MTADLRGPTERASSGDRLGRHLGAGAGLRSAAEVEIETSSGDIETDFPLQVTRHSRDHVVGQIGSGTGRVAIETGSGDIRLLKNPN